jgi:hypothetical protein
MTIENLSLACPRCRALKTRRSKRRSAMDHLFGFGGVLPWRCGACETRFYARAMPVRHHFYAHCGICGNGELQRIAADHVPGVAAILWRVLRIPALRCEPCRHKFFSVRPLLKERRVQATLAN